MVTKFNFIIPQGTFKLSKTFHHNGKRQGYGLKEASHLHLFHLNILTRTIGLIIIYSLYRDILEGNGQKRALGIIKDYKVGIVCVGITP